MSSINNLIENGMLSLLLKQSMTIFYSPSIYKLKKPLFFISVMHSTIIIEALSKCLQETIFMVLLESLMTHSKALLFFTLEPSKFNRNLLLG